MMVVAHKKIFFAISGAFVLASIVVMLIWGLPLGIDFTGGSVVEIEYTQQVETMNARPATTADIEELMAPLDLGDISVRFTGASGAIIRTRSLTEEEHIALLAALAPSGEKQFEEKRFSTVGPTIGQELRRKALYAMLLVVVLIVAYIAFAFRKVSEPVRSWKYGVAAIIALIHDIIIPTGVIVVLGHFGTATADTLFVMALLAILGLSVNDTIVVFDRIRENLEINKTKRASEPFSDTVGRGLSQTYARSINTSLTTLFVLLTLFFIGGPTIHNFVLTLIVGVIAGTYSSIFLASPLLIMMARGAKS